MTDESQAHIVRAFDEELQGLKSTISRMGGLAEAQLEEAINSVVKRDIELAHKARKSDQQIDEMEDEIDQQALRLLALRQPVAVDLRSVVAALKISAELERIGDYAKNIAKRTEVITQSPRVELVGGIHRMGKMTREQISAILDAYANDDVDSALEVWQRDEEIDAMYTSIFRELLTYMMEDPRNITPCTHLVFVAKNIERIGDHATNIAELLYFQETGERLSDERPKKDLSVYQVADVDED